MDSKKALVVISFGSTFDETRTHDIGGIEQALAAAFPAYDQYRAFTSVIIRKRLAERGIKIDDTETVLQKLVDAGYEEVVLQPTHLLHGEEFEQKILSLRDKFTAKFQKIIISQPLGYRTIRVPGHFEDYTTQETHYYYDKDGKRHYWTEDVVRQRWVPESFHPYAQLSLIYNFYDLSDGTLVASFSDSRNREYENAPAGGMLNRSLKDCFKKIFRK